MIRIGFGQTDVTPLKPVHKFAPLGKGILTTKVADELVCKITELQNEDGSRYIHISCPFGGIPRRIYQRVFESLSDCFAEKIILTMAATHTHYAPNLAQEEEYASYVCAQIVQTVKAIPLHHPNSLTCCYQRAFFDKVGQSRISGQPSKYLYLETFSLYEDEKRQATWIIYNSHPTTQRFTYDFLSGAGPAILMHQMEKTFPGEFFSYMIGAAGDVSTRFTRTGQDYEDMLAMTKPVAEEVCRQLDCQTGLAKTPVAGWEVEEFLFDVERAPKDMSQIYTGNLTERELETLAIAKEKHKAQDLSLLPRKIPLQRLKLGEHVFLFTPFELFSGYLASIDLNTCTLVNLANGTTGYLSCPGPQKLCFELVGETIPDHCKEKLIKFLQDWGSLTQKGEKP